MEEIAIARAFHVASVVVWIGGVTMATVIFIPAIRRSEFGEDWLAAFHAIERRFIWVARVAALIVGVTGFYLVAKLDLWSRFSSIQFWWMDAMLGLWLLFMIVLFVVYLRANASGRLWKRPSVSSMRAHYDFIRPALSTSGLCIHGHLRLDSNALLHQPCVGSERC